MVNVPVWEKVALTLEEAAAFSISALIAFEKLRIMKIARLFYLSETKGLLRENLLKNILSKRFQSDNGQADFDMI